MGESGTVDILIADDPAATTISTTVIEVPADSVLCLSMILLAFNS
jgi:hypothetical protein